MQSDCNARKYFAQTNSIPSSINHQINQNTLCKCKKEIFQTKMQSDCLYAQQYCLVGFRLDYCPSVIQGFLKKVIFQEWLKLRADSWEAPVCSIFLFIILHPALLLIMWHILLEQLQCQTQNAISSCRKWHNSNIVCDTT